MGVDIVLFLRILEIGQFTAVTDNQDIAHTDVAVDPPAPVEEIKPFPSGQGW